MTATVRPGSPLDHGEPPPADAAGDAGLGDIEARLATKYPDVDPRAIRTAVHDCYRAFQGARVRTFVPLLVENRAGRALRARRATA